MGTETVISARNLTKTYRLYDSREDRVKEAFHPLRKKYHRPFNALYNITFDVTQGETFGIVGRNGSGKSTLVQLIAGVLHPTSGELSVNGKVSALLELGTGFNPEFTGRENVFINGSILGLKREDLETRLDDILAFADIGKFIDQPVKTYSSGMYVRLAFAIAINVEPDILVVDEALAVGDIYFQHKCMTRMHKLMEEGCTLVFVSHDIGAVKALCNRAVFLDNGEMVAIGEAEKVANKYYYSLIEQGNMAVENGDEQDSGPENTDAGGNDVEVAHSASDSTQKPESAESRHRNTPVFSSNREFAEKADYYRSGTGDARAENVQLLDSGGREIAVCGFGDELCVRVHVRFNRDLEETNAGFFVKDKHGVEVIGTNMVAEKLCIPKKRSGETLVVDFRFKNILKEGTYSVTVALGKSDERGRYNLHTYDWVDNAYVFTVEKPVDKHITSIVSVPVKIDISDGQKNTVVNNG